MSQERENPPAPAEGGLSADQAVRRPLRVLELERSDPGAAERLWGGLEFGQRLRGVLNAPAAERNRLITLAPDARALTRALAPDEFAATVLAVEADEAGELLARSTDAQLTYLLDLTGWVAERFAPQRYASWLPLLLEGGAPRLQRWLASADPEVLALLFAHWFRVEKFLPSQDQQEPPDGLPEFTLDGVYFIEFRDQKTAGFVAQLLTVLKSELAGSYTRVLESMLWESAAQLAEDALRWRTGRLMDAGFPSRLEALELWGRPRPGEADWRKLPPKRELGFLAGAPPRSDAAARLLPAEEMLPRLAGRLEPEAADRLRAELAYLANCGVVALEADPARPQAVERAARESLGLANLGLGLVSQDDPAAAAAALERVGLAALARQGAAALREVNQRAWRLIREGWLAEMPNSLHLLDHPLDRWIAGLVFPRPRCYDPGLGGDREYRSFAGLADLEMARRAVARAEFWGVLLFQLMGLEPGRTAELLTAEAWPEDPRERKLSAVVGTWLARRALGLEGLAPLPAGRLGEAVRALQEGLAGPLAEELGRGLHQLSDPAEAALAGELLRGALGLLRQELGGLDPEARLEPAFLAGLVVEK
jgi:hypothetical protein